MLSIWGLLLALSLFGPLYAIVMGGLLRRGAPKRPDAQGEHRVICIVPCLNEGVVVAETVTRLLKLDEKLDIVVVDDASDDETPQVLRRIRDPRVHVVRREFPNARVGKGAALNQALAQISASVKELDIDSSEVVIAVFDADGHVDPGVLEAVRPWFTDSEVGAVQIGVRINNRNRSLVARFQDIEFAAYTEIFQYARNFLTSTGLGGNGQFVRLSALESLGPNPWSNCLTEDLDLGMRLRLNDWRSIFEGSVAVHQQGLHQIGRLIRQRTRWFQGHLQSWGLLRPVWSSNLPLAAKLDMSGHLILPVAMLLISVGVFASLIALVRNLVLAPSATLSLLMAGPFVPWWYLLGFVATPLIAGAYWRAEPEVGFVRGLLLSHAYSFYTWIWVPAGWKAVYRQLLGLGGWAKTDRTQEGDIVLPVLPLFSYDSIHSLSNNRVLNMLGLDSSTNYDDLVIELDTLWTHDRLSDSRDQDSMRRLFNEVTARQRLAAVDEQDVLALDDDTVGAR